jgi:hypothetical protein
MALARVVVFNGVTRERVDEMNREMEGQEPPEDIPASEFVVLHDPEADKSVVIFFFETDADYQRADEAPKRDASRRHSGTARVRHEIRRRDAHDALARVISARTPPCRSPFGVLVDEHVTVGVEGHRLAGVPDLRRDVRSMPGEQRPGSGQETTLCSLAKPGSPPVGDLQKGARLGGAWDQAPPSSRLRGLDRPAPLAGGGESSGCDRDASGPEQSRFLA